MNNLGLGFVFTVRDLASARIQRLERSFHTLDQRVGLGAGRIDAAFTRMAVGLGVFTAGAVAIGGAFALASTAGRFETAIAQVAAVSDASATELQGLRDAALEAGVATQFSPTEAALGLRELAQVGFGARDSMQMLIPVLDLAAASMGELSPEAAAGLAAQTLHAFGLEVGQAAHSVDQLMQAANLFALDAGELAMGLGTASRGSQALHQSLGETLATLGLVKNVVPGIERASTDVAVAMERMADPRTQRALRGVGVDVVRDGQFRSFLDIVQEMGPALSQMTEAQRSAFLMSTFGHHAMGGLSAIMTALNQGVLTQSHEMLRGAEAVDYLRNSFEHSDGAAAHFRETMLATFEGQERLLRGSLETLAITLGQPFTDVFRPMIGGVVDAVNGLIALFRGLPAPVMRALAAAVVAGGAFLALVGAVVASIASAGLLAIAFEAAGVTLGGLGAVLAPAILLAGALTLAFVAMRLAWDRNVGGIADGAIRAWNQIRVAFEALTQLFETGELSGAVQHELARAEQSGLRAFVIRIYMLGYRIARLFEGVRDGFVAAVDAAAPGLGELQIALTALSIEVGALMDALSGGAAHLPSEEYARFGGSIGQALGSVLRAIVQLITWSARFGTGFVRGLRDAGEVVAPVWNAIRKTFNDLRRELGVLGIVEQDTGGAAESFDSLREAGIALGQSLGSWLAARETDLLMFISAMLAIVRAAEWVRDRVQHFAASARTFFAEIALEVSGVFAVVMAIGSRVDSALRTALLTAQAYIAGVSAAIDAALGSAEARVRGVLRLVPPELLPAPLADFAHGGAPTGAPTPLPAEGNPVRLGDVAGPMPAVAVASAQASGDASLLGAMRAALAPDRRVDQRRQDPLTIALQVDGETLARVTTAAGERAASRAFAPVPVFG